MQRGNVCGPVWDGVRRGTALTFHPVRSAQTCVACAIEAFCGLPILDCLHAGLSAPFHVCLHGPDRRALSLSLTSSQAHRLKVLTTSLPDLWHPDVDPRSALCQHTN